MPQWRKLHTKAVESFDIQEMPDDFTRLLWIMLPLKLCKEGRGVDSSSWVKSMVMPMRDDVSCKQVGAALDWFADHGMIERYAVDGRGYFYIVTWHEYQSTDREADSPYPPPPGWESMKVAEAAVDEDYEKELVTTHSGPTQDLLKSKSRLDIEIDLDSDSENPPEGAGAPATPPPEPPGKPENKKTPEAVKVFRANTHRYPAKAWYADVDEAVGDAEADLDFWGNVVKAWVGLGWNPSNVKGMLDFYGRREIPAVKGNTRIAQSKRTMSKPPAQPVDPAQVERDRAALRAHRAKQKAEAANVG